jgi:hypothetical protein
MKMSGYVAGAAMALLVLGPNAIAQQGPTPGQPGSTTGPAAGTIVQPSTAVQKETPTAGSRGATAALDLPPLGSRLVPLLGINVVHQGEASLTRIRNPRHMTFSRLPLSFVDPAPRWDSPHLVHSMSFSNSRIFGSS